MNSKRTLLAILAASAVALVGATTVAATETEWRATFDASGWVEFIGPGDTAPPAPSAVFEYDESGVSGVMVTAVGQHIEGTMSDLVMCIDGDCERRRSHGFVPARVVAIQSYAMHVEAASVSLVPYTLPSSTGGKGLFAEVISGPIVGDVNGAFVTGEGPGKTAGSLGLGMAGTGAFACFAPHPGPLAPCMAGDGIMLPLDLDFIAEGLYAIDVTEHAGGNPGDTVFELGELEVEMLLHADLTGLAQHHTDAITSEGSITVRNMEISYE